MDPYIVDKKLVAAMAVVIVVLVATVVLLGSSQKAQVQTTTTQSSSLTTTAAPVSAVTPTTTQVNIPNVTNQIILSGRNVTVDITNSQNVPTIAGFQQMISFNPSQYAHYANSNLGNIRFYQGSNRLYSWCESGCSNSSNKAIFWVLLPSAIDSVQGLQINMVFKNMSTNYDGVYAGEAPQLSPVYAQFDNAQKIFVMYDNFMGQQLDDNWVNLTGGFYVSNGITFYRSGSVASLIEYNPSTYVAEAYAHYQYGVNKTYYPRFGYESTTTSSSSNCGYAINAQPNSTGTQYQLSDNNSCGGNGGSVQIVGGNNNGYNIFGLFESGNGVMASINYANTTINTQYPHESNMYLYFSSKSGAEMAVQWVRLRYIPPLGVMPSVTFEN